MIVGPVAPAAIGVALTPANATVDEPPTESTITCPMTFVPAGMAAVTFTDALPDASIASFCVVVLGSLIVTLLLASVVALMLPSLLIANKCVTSVGSAIVTIPTGRAGCTGVVIIYISTNNRRVIHCVFSIDKTHNKR